jgi:hypothetical protein
VGAAGQAEKNGKEEGRKREDRGDDIGMSRWLSIIVAFELVDTTGCFVASAFA